MLSHNMMWSIIGSKSEGMCVDFQVEKIADGRLDGILQILHNKVCENSISFNYHINV